MAQGSLRSGTMISPERTAKPNGFASEWSPEFLEIANPILANVASANCQARSAVSGPRIDVG